MTGTRKDLRVVCQECGREIRRGNLERHVEARHGDTAYAARLREAKVREMIEEAARAR